MCVYIFPARLFPKYLMTQCALILSSSRWHCLIHNDDVMFQITAGIKQNNIIRTGLNDFVSPGPVPKCLGPPREEMWAWCQ